jgi:ABC-type lipoprotein release transport system permease subunit
MKRGLRKDKRGLEIAFSTIVVIVLAVVVLIFLIVFFNQSTSGFKNRILTLLGSSNIDSIKDSCNTQAIQNSDFEYCCVNKTVKLSSKQSLQLTCEKATQESWGSSITKLNCEGVC